MAIFGNVLTAMVTPFKKNLSVDYAMAEKLAVHLCQNGSDGLVLHGTTGESPTLSHEEEYELYRVVKKAVGGKCKIVAGTGSNSTATTVKSTKKAEKIGVDGAMIVVPLNSPIPGIVSCSNTFFALFPRACLQTPPRVPEGVSSST